MMYDERPNDLKPYPFRPDPDRYKVNPVTRRVAGGQRLYNRSGATGANHLNWGWSYVPAEKTNIRDTFAKIRLSKQIETTEKTYARNAK